jgi:parvulin-like peptidyl-prolyl isomerase
VKLRMIVLNKQAGTDGAQTRALADDILTKIKEGASFTEMANVNSQAAADKKNGDWGWVERPVLRKELADVAFKLKAGERSEVIDTPEACYLMQVDETRPTHFKTLGEVRDEIEKNLLLEEQSRLEKQWIDRLKKKTFVRYF